MSIGHTESLSREIFKMTELTKNEHMIKLRLWRDTYSFECFIYKKLKFQVINLLVNCDNFKSLKNSKLPVTQSEVDNLGDEERIKICHHFSWRLYEIAQWTKTPA